MLFCRRRGEWGFQLCEKVSSRQAPAPGEIGKSSSPQPQSRPGPTPGLSLLSVLFSMQCQLSSIFWSWRLRKVHLLHDLQDRIYKPIFFRVDNILFVRHLQFYSRKIKLALTSFLVLPYPTTRRNWADDWQIGTSISRDLMFSCRLFCENSPFQEFCIRGWKTAEKQEGVGCSGN